MHRSRKGLCAALALACAALAPGAPLRADDGPIHYDPYLKEESPAVLQVRNDRVPWDLPADQQHPCRAKRGDEVWFDVTNLERWLYDNGEKAALTFDAKENTFDRAKDRDPVWQLAQKLVPYVNGNALKGTTPDAVVYWQTTAEVKDADGTVHTVPRWIHYLRYTLAPLKDNKDNQDAWHRLWMQPDALQRRMEVTLGTETGGTVLPTAVTERSTLGAQQFYLILLPGWRFTAALAVIVASLVLFWSLAYSSDLLRDRYAAPRPDGRQPYSLSSTQMAFWLFAVVAAFLFLWLLTGALDCLNTTALALIGISSATGLAAKWVRPADDAHAKPKPKPPPVDINQPRRKIVQEVQARIDAADKELAAAKTARGALPVAALTGPDPNAALIHTLTARVDVLTHQAAYFRQPAWRGFLLDLLAEDNSISFHRFQIVVWTMALGVMFISNVATDLAMPDFSATTLGLLGISAGTYLGFKVPDK